MATPPMEGLSYIIRTDDSGSGIDQKESSPNSLSFAKTASPMIGQF